LEKKKRLGKKKASQAESSLLIAVLLGGGGERRRDLVKMSIRAVQLSIQNSAAHAKSGVKAKSWPGRISERCGPAVGNNKEKEEGREAG